MDLILKSILFIFNHKHIIIWIKSQTQLCLGFIPGSMLRDYFGDAWGTVWLYRGLNLGGLHTYLDHGTVSLATKLILCFWTTLTVSLATKLMTVFLAIKLITFMSLKYHGHSELRIPKIFGHKTVCLVLFVLFSRLSNFFLFLCTGYISIKITF